MPLRALVCAAALLAAGCPTEPRKEDRMAAEVLGAKVVKQCVGRFCLTVPAGMARSADTHVVQGVTLEEVAWDASAKDPWEAEWLKRLQQIEGLKSRRYLPSDAHGTILEQRMFKPGSLKGVFYCAEAIKEVATFGAIYNAGEGGLWLQMDASVKNKEVPAERIAEIAPTYRLAEPGAPPPRGAYSLVRGYLAAPFKLAEEAHARFLDSSQKLDLSFSSETTFEPRKDGLMARFSSALERSAASLFAGIRPVRSQKRKVAGLPGEELVLHGTEGKKGELSFTWTTPGEARSGRHPEIGIELTTPDDHQEERLKLWDALLDGITPAP
jgi:type VI secretion system (T6SS) Tli4-like immunity protein